MQLISKYASIVAQLLITAILARLLTPDDYGLMAIVAVFTAFFSMFSDVGIGVAIVQFRDLTERDFGAIFFFSLVLGLFLSTAFCLASVPISFAYGNEELSRICCAVAPSLFFACMNMVPNGLMLREKRFVAAGVRLVVASILSGALAILAAFFGWGVYALALQAVLLSLVVLVWNLLARPIRQIDIHFVGVLQKIFSYSAWQFGFTAINYFSRNLDNLLIGKVLGSISLAYYSNAYRLTTYPMSALSGVVASVIQPFMAEHQDNNERMRACFWRVEKTLSLLGVPIAVVMFCCAEEITLLFYGSQWAGSVPLLQVLSLSVYSQIVGNPSGAFYQSTGRTDLLFRAGLINTAITVFCLCIGLYADGVLGAAFGIAVAYCLHLIATYRYLLHDVLGIYLREIRAFLPEICLGIAACVVCYLVDPFVANFSLAVSGAVKAGVSLSIIVVGYFLSGQIKVMKLLLGGKSPSKREGLC